MSKTSQNLKVLEKKIRQAAKMMEDLHAARHTGKGPHRGSGYTDLPLLKELSSGRSSNPDIKKLIKEREQLKKRVQKVLMEIEKVMN